MSHDPAHVGYRELEHFTRDVLCAAGVAAPEATVVASVLIWSDLIGRTTQGVWRLADYLKRFRLGLITSPCHAEFNEKAPTLFTLDGKDGFGQYLGHLAMDRAIAAADEHGIGLVAVSHSNHFGAAAYYVQRAAQSRKIGIAVSNAYPHVAPSGGIDAVLGTNPFAFAAPARNGQSLLIDLSTSASSGSMIRKAAEEGKDIPGDTVIDAEGHAVVDATRAVQGVILPFGGAKGFCLSLMVEILSGVISGAGVSHGVASMYQDFTRSCNTGHLFIALDITKLMPIESYFARLEGLIGIIKSSTPEPGTDEILIPGETRWRNHARQTVEGIALNTKTAASLAALAREFKLVLPW